MMHTITITIPDTTSHDRVDRVTTRLLIGPGDEGCAQLAAVRIEVPPRRLMAPHTHGDAEALLTLLSGQAVLRSGRRASELSPGVLAHIGVGERVEVENTGDDVATLLAVFSPPEFAARLPRQSPGRPAR